MEGKREKGDKRVRGREERVRRRESRRKEEVGGRERAYSSRSRTRIDSSLVTVLRTHALSAAPLPAAAAAKVDEVELRQALR